MRQTVIDLFCHQLLLFPYISQPFRWPSGKASALSEGDPGITPCYSQSSQTNDWNIGTLVFSHITQRFGCFLTSLLLPKYSQHVVCYVPDRGFPTRMVYLKHAIYNPDTSFWSGTLEMHLFYHNTLNRLKQDMRIVINSTLYAWWDNIKMNEPVIRKTAVTKKFWTYKWRHSLVI